MGYEWRWLRGGCPLVDLRAATGALSSVKPLRLIDTRTVGDSPALLTDQTIR
jgi:hypothetical protein